MNTTPMMQWISAIAPRGMGAPANSRMPLTPHTMKPSATRRCMMRVDTWCLKILISTPGASLATGFWMTFSLMGYFDSFVAAFSSSICRSVSSLASCTVEAESSAVCAAASAP